MKRLVRGAPTPWRLSSVLLAGVCATAAPEPPCGVTAVRALCVALAQPLENAAETALRAAAGSTEMTLDQVKALALRCGLSVRGVRATLAELGELNRPCLVHLTGPDHFAVLVDRADDRAQLLDDRGHLVMLPETELARRFSGLALVPVDPPAAAGPRALLQPPSHDVGPLALWASVQRDFAVTNTGRAPLDVKLLTSSCTCTATVTETLTIAPGATAVIPVKMQVRELGSVLNTMVLTTNDPLRPRLYLSLLATAARDIQIAPSSIMLEGLRGETTTATCWLTGPPGLTLLSADAEAAWVDVALAERTTERDATRYRLTATAQLSGPVGETTTVLRFRTNVEAARELSVPVTRRIRSVFSLEPRALLFDKLRPGSSCSTKLRLRCLSDEPFAITAATTAHPHVTIGAITRQADGSYDVALTITAGVAGLVEAPVVITTDVVDEAPQTVRVTTFVELPNQAE